MNYIRIFLVMGLVYSQIALGSEAGSKRKRLVVVTTQTLLNADQIYLERAEAAFNDSSKPTTEVIELVRNLAFRVILQINNIQDKQTILSVGEFRQFENLIDNVTRILGNLVNPKHFRYPEFSPRRGRLFLLTELLKSHLRLSEYMSRNSSLSSNLVHAENVVLFLHFQTKLLDKRLDEDAKKEIISDFDEVTALLMTVEERTRSFGTKNIVNNVPAEMWVRFKHQVPLKYAVDLPKYLDTINAFKEKNFGVTAEAPAAKSPEISIPLSQSSPASPPAGSPLAQQESSQPLSSL